jgi:hypothetical protein
MGRSGELFGFVKRRASLGALQIRRAGWVGLPGVDWVDLAMANVWKHSFELEFTRS